VHALHRRAVRRGVPGRLFLHHARRHRAAQQGPVHRLRLLLLRLSLRRSSISAGLGLRRAKYGRNRIAEGKLPLCAEMCATKALVAGDGDVVADIYRKRVLKRGGRPQTWGWEVAYKG
jgi:hypothetical protein